MGKQDAETGIQDIEALISGMNAGKKTRINAMKLYESFGTGIAFGRKDVMEVIGVSASPASELIKKLLEARLIRGAGERWKCCFGEMKYPSNM